MAERLTDAQVSAGLVRLPGWAREGDPTDRIVREFQFADFVAALGFIVEVGVLAERANHHPEITNLYAHVRIALWTHAAGGLTERDLRLAEAISARIPWLRPAP